MQLILGMIDKLQVEEETLSLKIIDALKGSKFSICFVNLKIYEEN